MFGATASLATTSAEDIHLFTVERVRPLSDFSDKDSEIENSIDMINWIGWVAFETI